MSNPPVILQGTAQEVSPTRVAAASASPAHAFFNVIRELVHKSGFHTEAEVLKAIESISRYEKHVVSPGDLRQVTSENDRAATEDVTRRIPPSNAMPQPLQVAAPIDYNQLAAALIAAQQAAATHNPEVPAE